MKKSKSRYAKKQSRKLGRGKRSPLWMSWVETQGKERPIEQNVGQGPIARFNTAALRAVLLGA